jgi:2-aminoadipate transaminase
MNNNTFKSQEMQQGIFSDRIHDVPRSFIREILKVAISKNVISFAGGLPNRELFPIAELKMATAKVFDEAGMDALQYSDTEGYKPLREYIANRYFIKQGIRVSPDNILITSGSQQGLDLLGKTILNEGDEVIIEQPGYLGAIQAFSVYRATFQPVPLTSEGMDTAALSKVLKKSKAKLMYTVPEFQNPSGISYSNYTRTEVAKIISGKKLLLIEDCPYIDLRFSGQPTTSFYKLAPDQTVLLGTFSKTIVPSFRLGWIVAPDPLMDKLITAKQASDLHTNYFVQRIIYQYLMDYNSDLHIAKICKVYGQQKNAMIESIKKHFPKEVSYTVPQGGMFLWVTLPNHISTMELFDVAIKQDVAFVPGNPFYTDGKQSYNTLRLNFSCSDEVAIEEGIKRLGNAINELVSKISS